MRNLFRYLFVDGSGPSPRWFGWVADALCAALVIGFFVLLYFMAVASPEMLCNVDFRC